MYTADRDESISEIRLADIDLGPARVVQKKIDPSPSIYGGLSGGAITKK